MNAKDIKKKKIKKIPKLKGLSICTSGFEEEENIKIKERIKEEEGNYEENLKKGTSILISNKINTYKTLMAKRNKIIIVNKEWILDNKSNLDLTDKKYYLPCFYNVTFFLFGFSDDIFLNMKKIIEEKGGTIISSFKDSEVIIFKNGLNFTNKELKEVNKYNEKIVSEKWFDDCIFKNTFLDFSKYKYQSDEILNKFDELKKIIENFEEVQNIFSGKIFHIREFGNNKIKKCLFQLISYCNGIIFDKIIPLTNIIIVPFSLENIQEIETFNNKLKPIFTTPNFIIDSISNRKIQDPKKYKPFKSFIDDNLNNKIIYNTKKNYIISDLFKGETFSIVSQTYSEKEYNLIKEKIIENHGEIIDLIYDELKILRAKVIILNDGYLKEWNDFIEANNDNKHLIVSHRYIDECIERKKKVDFDDYLNLFPFNFKIPLNSFKNFEFFLPSSYFTWNELRGNERLIETLGGKCDLSKNTNFIMINCDKMKKKEFEELKKKSNKNIKVIKDEWLTKTVIDGGKIPEIEDFLVKNFE